MSTIRGPLCDCEYCKSRDEVNVPPSASLYKEPVKNGALADVRVSFVHAQYKKIDRSAESLLSAGRLRQLTDWMALSLKRTVTLCELSVIVDVDGKAVPVPIAQGFALCHWTDQFVKKTGRVLALKRALRVSPFAKDQQRLIWENEGFTVEDYANTKL